MRVLSTKLNCNTEGTRNLLGGGGKIRTLSAQKRANLPNLVVVAIMGACLVATKQNLTWTLSAQLGQSLCPEVRWGEMRKVTLTVIGDTLAGRKQLKVLVMLRKEGHLGGLDTSVEGHPRGLETVEGPSDAEKRRTLGRAPHFSTYFGERRHSTSTFVFPGQLYPVFGLYTGRESANK